jgi:hypothetical protein
MIVRDRPEVIHGDRSAAIGFVQFAVVCSPQPNGFLELALLSALRCVAVVGVHEHGCARRYSPSRRDHQKHFIRGQDFLTANRLCFQCGFEGGFVDAIYSGNPSLSAARACVRCSGFCRDPRNRRSHLHTSSHNPKGGVIIEFFEDGLKERGLVGAFLLPWAQEVPSSNLGAPTKTPK